MNTDGSAMNSDTKTLSEKNRNDNSNPQQGTGEAKASSGMKVENAEMALPVIQGYMRPSIVVPPTAKDERKLFVGGLPPLVTSKEFRSFFEQFGPVLDSIVLIDKFSGRSRGFGFVTFQDTESARKVLSMRKKEGGSASSGFLEMQGKTIEVKPAQPKESTRRIPSIATATPVVSPPAPSYQTNMMPGPYYMGQPNGVTGGYQSQGGAYFAGYMAPVYYMPESMPPMQGGPFYMYPPAHPNSNAMMEHGFAPQMFHQQGMPVAAAVMQSSPPVDNPSAGNHAMAPNMATK